MSHIKNVSVVKNNGSVAELTNQCFWISISNWLNYFLQLDVSVSTLRQIASTNHTIVNAEHEMVDTTTHEQAILNVANKYNLSIRIYVQIGNNNFNSNIQQINTEYCVEISSNKIVQPYNVDIISYGLHFELIDTTTVGYHFTRQNLTLPTPRNTLITDAEQLDIILAISKAEAELTKKQESKKCMTQMLADQNNLLKQTNLSETELISQMLVSSAFICDEPKKDPSHDLQLTWV